MLFKNKKLEIAYTTLEEFLKEKDLSIAKKVIKKGFFPFPEDNAVRKLLSKPVFLKLFLEEGASFTELFASSSKGGIMAGMNIVALAQIFREAYFAKIRKKVTPESNALWINPEIFKTNQAPIDFLDILVEYNYFDSNHYQSVKKLIDERLEQEKIKKPFNAYLQAILEAKKIKDGVGYNTPNKKLSIL